MELTKIISSKIDKLKRRLIMVSRFGEYDTREPFQANNFGIDSNPIKDMIAVYSGTNENGKSVIIGYLNRNQLAEPGETRIFSVDSGGDLKTYIWLTKTGTIKLGGDADNAVRYSPLNTGLNNLVTQLQTELVSIAAGISAAGGSYSPGMLSVDISNSKVDKITTP